MTQRHRLTKILCFANKLLQLAVSAFSCFVVSIISKTSMFVNDWYSFFFIQNHSALTQLFYMTMSSSPKPLVHDLTCSEMLQELLLHQAEKQESSQPWQPWLSQPPYLPTSSYATAIWFNCTWTWRTVLWFITLVTSWQLCLLGNSFEYTEFVVIHKLILRISTTGALQ